GTDTKALVNGSQVPANYTFVASDAGSHTFTVAFQTAGAQTVTVTDGATHFAATTSPINVAVTFSKFTVNLLGGNSLVAGNSLLFSVQAADQFGNPVTTYTGPGSVTITSTPADPLGNLPITGALTSAGTGLFLGTFKTAGVYTLTATAAGAAAHRD